MARFNPKDVFSSFSSIAALNANFDDISDLMERVMFRDGTAPNSLLADLDANHNKLRNVEEATSLTDAPNYGQVLALVGNNGDSDTLRAELALDTGAGLVGTLEGITVQEALDSIDEVAAGAFPLTNYEPRETAYNHARAKEMANDLSGMVGYAAWAGTTGGTGQTEYWVLNNSDDEGKEGSLRWAVAQAITNGGGMILFDPTKKFDIVLTKPLIIGATTTDGSGNPTKVARNITLDAPGRNVNIWNDPKVEGTRISGENIIVRRIFFGNLAGDYEDLEERDGFSTSPRYSNKVWVDECTMEHISDGVGDTSSSALVATDGACYVTYSRCIVRNQDKAYVIGKTGSYTVDLTQAPVIYSTFYKMFWDYSGQRMPRVSQFGFAHVVNCVMDLNPVYRPWEDTPGSAQGVHSIGGGKVNVVNCLFRAKTGSGYKGVIFETDSAGQTSGCVAEDGITIDANRSTSSLPAIPYTLSPEVIPADQTARDAWADSIYQTAGAARYPEPSGLYVFEEGAPEESPDGVNIRLTDGGYYQRIAAPDPALPDQSKGLVLTRENQDIVGGAITVDGSTFLSIDTEVVAGTNIPADDLETINGGANGVVIGLRSTTASRVITVKSTGNIDVPNDVILDDTSKNLWLRYDNGVSKWQVIALPTYVSGDVYAPTITTSANSSAVTLVDAVYNRVDNSYTASVRFTMTATSAGVLSSMMVTLPVTSDLDSIGDLIGVGTAFTGSEALPVWVEADTTNNRANVKFYPTTAGGAYTITVTFQFKAL